MQTAGDIAVPIVGGSKLVMQIHYHPAGQTHAPDKTGIDLRITNAWPQRMYFVTAFGNEFQAPSLQPGPGDNGTPRFLIPKNTADHTEHMRVTIPNLGNLTDVRLFSANPHMHLVGTHIAATLERPAARGGDPKTECVANGGWNFDWQRTYQYDAPLDKLPTVQAGDVLDIKCRWDNTIAEPVRAAHARGQRPAAAADRHHARRADHERDVPRDLRPLGPRPAPAAERRVRAAGPRRAADESQPVEAAVASRAASHAVRCAPFLSAGESVRRNGASASGHRSIIQGDDGDHGERAPGTHHWQS